MPQIAAGGTQNVKVTLTPSERAIAGDYQATIRASGSGGLSESANFRITVMTSTLWGAIGIGDHRPRPPGRGLCRRALRPALGESAMADGVVIQAEALTKRYGANLAVDHVDFEVQAGEIVGILGPNGSGKTTTILMLLGLTEPTSGRAMVAGFDPLRDPLEVKRRVGYLPDQIGFYEGMSARDNLAYTARLAGLAGARSTGVSTRRSTASGCTMSAMPASPPIRRACASGSASPKS